MSNNEPIQHGQKFSKKGTTAAPATSEKTDAKAARVSVIVRLTAAERKSLRMIAVEQDTTVQALVEQAVHQVIAHNEK